MLYTSLEIVNSYGIHEFISCTYFIGYWLFSFESVWDRRSPEVYIHFSKMSLKRSCVNSVTLHRPLPRWQTITYVLSLLIKLFCSCKNKSLKGNKMFSCTSQCVFMIRMWPTFLLRVLIYVGKGSLNTVVILLILVCRKCQTFLQFILQQ